jgi:hypothetical protein
MSYALAFKPSAEKELRKLSHGVIPRIVSAIQGLGGHGWPRGSAALRGGWGDNSRPRRSAVIDRRYRNGGDSPDLGIGAWMAARKRGPPKRMGLQFTASAVPDVRIGAGADRRYRRTGTGIRPRRGRPSKQHVDAPSRKAHAAVVYWILPLDNYILPTDTRPRDTSSRRRAQTPRITSSSV